MEAIDSRPPAPPYKFDIGQVVDHEEGVGRVTLRFRTWASSPCCKGLSCVCSPDEKKQVWEDSPKNWINVYGVKMFDGQFSDEVIFCDEHEIVRHVEPFVFEEEYSSTEWNRTNSTSGRASSSTRSVPTSATVG